MLESVSQEKKSLRSVISYNAEAPPGYTFVPAGNPELTDDCKEISRTRGLKVYIVSAAPKNKAYKNPENISHHIHRIGHHFDNHVVDQACNRLGLLSRGRTYARAGATTQQSAFAQRLARHGKRLKVLGKNVSSQQRNQQVRETIRDLFPRIPDGDLEAIIDRAFQEGTSRVGNAEELSLPRRVQLATVAHIRHVYTDYDQLLKNGSYHSARAKVEQACLDQLVAWRGESGSDVKEIEDIFREVIVLDDSDDEDSNEPEQEEREPSVEIIFSQALPRDLELQSPRLLDVTGHPDGVNGYRSVEVIPRLQARRSPLVRDLIAQRYEEARIRNRDQDVRSLVLRPRGALPTYPVRPQSRHDIHPASGYSDHYLSLDGRKHPIPVPDDRPDRKSVV